MGNLYSTGVSDDDRDDLNRLVEDLMTAYINTTEVYFIPHSPSLLTLHTICISIDYMIVLVR
jgi:hypothetical protein